jgi:hypothetical protein
MINSAQADLTAIAFTATSSGTLGSAGAVPCAPRLD